MDKKYKKVFISLSFFLLSLIAILVIGLFGLPYLRTHKIFTSSGLVLESYDLFDLGVADINQDGYLDIFTTNHSAQQSVVLNDGKGQFSSNLITEFALDQDPQFPGLEDSLKQPEFQNPGLYIYRYNRDLYIRPYDLLQPISGNIKVAWPLQIDLQERTQAEIKESSSSLGGTSSTLTFTIQPSGILAFKGKEDIVELPHTVLIDETLPAKQIFIGKNRIQPSSHQFELTWRDRHSFAWVDLNNDRKMDVFISRGGVKGQLNKIADRISDEMMLMGVRNFDNKIDQFNFEKKDCPGRQSAWVDYNQDNLLDLYVACGRNEFPIYPNLLYQQQSDGKFIDVASKLGLGFPEEGAFRWLDFDQDGDEDLLVTREKSIELYLQQDGKFRLQEIVSDFPAKALNLLVSDFDADGDFDIYAESKYVDQPNLMLINENGAFQPINPKIIGLPETGLGGSWVDFDNDGLTDFYSVPYGLFQQDKKHNFKKTHLLDRRWNSAKSIDARSIWVDVDNDGDRDLLSAINQTPHLHERIIDRLLKLNLNSNWQKIWISELYQNKFNKNHWLELDLYGTPGNAQAIGSVVTVKTTYNEQKQTVGNTDSSYFSQGHYRLYFGLGKDKVAKSIHILWPDEKLQTINNLDADQIWRVQYNSSPSH